MLAKGEINRFPKKEPVKFSNIFDNEGATPWLIIYMLLIMELIVSL